MSLNPFCVNAWFLFLCFHIEHQMPHKHLNGTKFDLLTINHIPAKQKGECERERVTESLVLSLLHFEWIVHTITVYMHFSMLNVYGWHLPTTFFLFFYAIHSFTRSSLSHFHMSWIRRMIRVFQARFWTHSMSIIHSNSKGFGYAHMFTNSKDLFHALQWTTERHTDETRTKRKRADCSTEWKKYKRAR